ncbi:hypothetical protein TNCV_3856951 [Trichonephila clavipes]|nr:hypothetical protein TNCV_3856951 [Trichonephila clavipes]
MALMDSKPNLGARMTRRHFLDEFRLFLQHQDSRIRVWRHRGECTLTAYIRLRHTGQLPRVMLWGRGYGCTSRSPLVRIDGL